VLPLWRLAGAFAVALTVLFALPGVGGSGAPAALGMGAACAAAAVGALRAVRRGPRCAAAWMLAGGIVLYAAAMAVFVAALLRGPVARAPALADALWLPAYALLLGALALHVRAAAGGWSAVTRLDAGIAGLGALTLGAAVLDVLVDGSAMGLAALVTNLVYPIADLSLLGLVAAGVALTGDHASRAWWPVAVAALLLFAGDVGYLLRVVDGGAFTPLPLDAAFGLALLVAADLPGRGAPAASAPAAGTPRPVVPLACCALAVAVLAVDHAHPTSAVAVGLAVATLLLALLRMAGAFTADARLRASEHEALTDELTGLRNRRALLRDLGAATAPGAGGRTSTFALFDLDGFKTYNDAHGHPAGDALLAELGAALAAAVGGAGTAYRLGGDEFCVLVDAHVVAPDLVLAAALEALHLERGGVRIGCSHGRVALPSEATCASDALRLADARMYERKDARRPSMRNQCRDLLLRVISEQQPDLEEHGDDVSGLVAAVGRRLGLHAEDLDHAECAAELHDVGKVAVPAEVLRKPGPLDDREWAVMRRHTVIGERILASVPALVPVARLVRASHERWDGGGYPDGLRGEEIPLGARVIAVCDAFHAMTTDRVYRAGCTAREALAELERCAGSQFDPAVVAALADALADGLATAPAPRAAPVPFANSIEARELDTLTKLRGLMAVSGLARSGADVDEVLTATAEVIAGTLGFRTVAINVAEDDDDFAVRVVVGNAAARAALEGTTTRRAEWDLLLDARFASHGAYVVPDEAWPEELDAHVPAAPIGGSNAWLPGDALFVPLRARDGELLGVVSVDEPVWRRRPTDDELELLVAVVDHAALALERARAAAAA
jgi:diguanylate cyclase (GGDEF)-like protein